MLKTIRFHFLQKGFTHLRFSAETQFQRVAQRKRHQSEHGFCICGMVSGDRLQIQIQCAAIRDKLFYLLNIIEFDPDALQDLPPIRYG